jgi:hypothetical protein
VDHEAMPLNTRQRVFVPDSKRGLRRWDWGKRRKKQDFSMLLVLESFVKSDFFVKQQ